MEKLNGNPLEGLQRSFEDYTRQARTAFEDGTKLATDGASSMEGAFESLFFDAQRGKLQSLGDYWDAFVAGIEQSFSQILAQQAVTWILKQLGLAKLQNNSADATAVATTTSLTAAMAAQTGVVSALAASYYSLAAAKAAAGAAGAASGRARSPTPAGSSPTAAG